MLQCGTKGTDIHDGIRQNLAADDSVIYKLLLDLNRISNKPLARRGFRMCRVLQSISEPGLNKLGGKKKGEQERALCAFRVSCTSETSARVREVERG